jgi:FMN phosphatase YigB (HAD superfamily)
LNLSDSAWYGQTIKSTFNPFTSKANPLPAQLIPELLTRFSSSEGYRLYPDILPFFQTVRQARRISATEQGDGWPWNLTTIGVITNSDDRVLSILSSLGLGVGTRTVGRPERMSHNGTQSQPARNGYTVEMAPIGLPTAQCLDQLDEDIHFVVLSYDVGAEKPDPRIFQAAKDMFDFTIENENRSHPDMALSRKDKWTVGPESEKNADFIFLHIGNEVKKDVIGAQRAGAHSLLLDREGKYSQAFESGENKILSVPMNGGDSSLSHEMQVIQDLGDLRYWVPWPQNRRK